MVTKALRLFLFFLLRYLHDSNFPMAEKTQTNPSETVKSKISFGMFIG